MDYQSIRNFKDFLSQYNKISEDCFMHCVNDLGCRDLTSEEQLCAEKCAFKHVKLNNRAMQVYVEVQPAMTQKRIEEMNQQAAAAQPPPVENQEAVNAETTDTAVASSDNVVPSDTVTPA